VRIKANNKSYRTKVRNLDGIDAKVLPKKAKGSANGKGI
jgi:hypothetical protein